MGRMILTNNDNWCKRLQGNYEGLLDLPVTGTLDDGFHLRVYAKKRVENENYLKSENGIIATNGTIFYKGLMNKDALKKLLGDFTALLKEKEIGECIRIVRKDLIGSYCVIMVLAEFVIGFVDETSMCPIFYCLKDGQFLITNTYLNVNDCCKEDIREMALVEQCVCSSIVGNETPFNNIYRLLENEYIFIDKSENDFQIRTVELNQYKYRFNSFVEAVEMLSTEVEKIARVRSKYIHHTLLFATGGLDSRMELALYNLEDKNIKIGYWSGADIITNGTRQDLEISKKLAEITACPFEFYDVSEDFSSCIASLDHDEMRKYGEYARIYGHNRKWLEIVNHPSTEDIDSIGFGYLNELIKSASQVEKNWHNGFECYDFVKSVKTRTGVYHNVIECPKVIKYVSDKVQNLISSNSSMLSFEDSVNLFNRDRIHSNTFVDAFINTFFYSFNIFGQKRIIDLVESIPYEWRANSKITVALTKKWNSDLLKIPYYSHHHTVLYDSKSNSIKETNKTKIELYFRRLLKNTFLYKPIVSVGHKLRQKNNTLASESNSIVRECLTVLKNSESMQKCDVKIKDINNDVGFDLASLATEVAEICLIDISRKGM